MKDSIMEERPKRRSFNVAVVLLVLIAVISLGWISVYVVGEMLTDEPDSARADRVTGEVRGTTGVDASGVDPTTQQDGKIEPIAPDPRLVTLTLPGGTTVEATAMEAELLQYLESGQPAGRRFHVQSLGFIERNALRQEPEDSLTTLAAILNAFPQSRVRVEVLERNPGMAGPRDRAVQRAAIVARSLATHGVDADRITSAGVRSEDVEASRIELVITDR